MLTRILVSMPSFYLGSTSSPITETKLQKFTYSLMILNARFKVLNFFERCHRDQINPTSADHSCNDFVQDMVIPPKWRADVLNCRKCKRNLVSFLSHYFVEQMKRRLQPQQRFVTAGGFDGNLRNKAMFVRSDCPAQCDNQLESNAEESDTRIWLHVLNSVGQKKLVLSPDTDVYHIGLPFYSWNKS